MPTPMTPPLTIRFEKGSAPKTFETVEELRDWALAERNRWAALAKQIGGGVKGLNLRVQIDPFQNLYHEANITPANAERVQVIRNLAAQNQVQDRIISESPRGQWIMEIGAKDAARAAMLVGLWSSAVIEPHLMFQQDQELHARMALFIQSVLDSNSFKAGEEPAVRDAVSESIDRIFASGQESLAEQRATAADLKAARESHEKDLVKLKDAYRSTTDETVTSTKETIEQLVKESRKAFDDFRNQILTEMSLREPVAHWENKAETHATDARFMSKAFYAAVGVVVVSWAAALYFIIGDQTLRGLLFDQSNPFSLRPFIIFGVPLIFVLWLLRHISRRMLDSRALSEDARERAVIARALLALEDQKITSPEQRVLLIQALTRPSAVTASDETAPTSLLEALIKRGKD